jgi:hypothetical protein
MKLIISNCSYILLKSQGLLIALNLEITMENKISYEPGNQV